MKRLAIFAVIAGLVCGSALAQAKKQGSTAAKTAPAKKAATPGAAFNPALLKPASLNATAPAEYEVKFTTAKGDFVIKVTRAWSPQGADRFYNLVKNRFYDGAAFFRVITGFMVQFGISAHPPVSAAWHEANIPDDTVKASNKRGFISFATSGPNSRTTQVFINFGDNARLDAMGFSPFGEVTQGMDVVDAIYAGYGEGAPRGNGPSQDRMQAEGRKYLEADFAKLDTIKTTSIVGPAPAATAPAKKASAKKAPAKKS